ncbi:hypothetical protein [Intrasporangium oryzae]|uniref:hypothetical protein n=1 Tax=Intrasporangium oryzae TaxID=412687 RepID=UPI000A02EB38|nr:hypothetical protein [Intrasporangium oryzae]
MTSERVLRVGVTGHRSFTGVDAAAACLRKGLRRLLALTRSVGGEGDGAGTRIELVSSLAEGADRLVAREVLALPGTTLSVVLPVPVEDYEGDFETEESRSEFERLLARADAVEVMPPAASRDTAYVAQGRWVVDHSDVLVAVWDGRPARGPGGTGKIVAYAAANGVPLLWVEVERT